MTNREAIERLKSMLCKDEYPNGENSKAFQLDTEAIDIAIEALEKQIPKKLEMLDRGNVLLCQNCHFDLIGVFDFPHEGNEQMPRYCPNCSQAIDWSIENDQ